MLNSYSKCEIEIRPSTFRDLPIYYYVLGRLLKNLTQIADVLIL